MIVENPLRQNRMLTAADVAELGFADRLLEPVEFVDESLAFARELAERPLEREAPDWSDARDVVPRARTAVDDAVHGAAPAPYVGARPDRGRRAWSLEEGYRARRTRSASCSPGPQAQASIYAFGLVERRAKKHPARPETEPRKVQKVGIVGAGLMARQLATLFLRRLEVPIVHPRREAGDRRRGARRHPRRDRAQVRRAVTTRARPASSASLVSGGTGWDGFEDCDLVLEAVFEELA